MRKRDLLTKTLKAAPISSALAWFVLNTLINLRTNEQTNKQTNEQTNRQRHKECLTTAKKERHVLEQRHLFVSRFLSCFDHPVSSIVFFHCVLPTLPHTSSRLPLLSSSSSSVFFLPQQSGLQGIVRGGGGIVRTVR